MTLNKTILRVFEVRAKPGHTQTLKQKLSDASIAVVRGEPGNGGYLFGECLSATGRDLVFISLWQDLAAVKARFGEKWEESFLPPGYEDSIEQCSVRHLEVEGEVLDSLRSPESTA